MATTSQMLVDYPDVLLQVLAELRGAFLDAADNREQAIELLAAQITDPTSVQFAYQEVVDMTEGAEHGAKQALDALLSDNGEMIEAQFARDYGSVRKMGPAKLEREMPWLYPESIAELLYYYGLIGRGFKGVGQNAHTIIYLPTDITPWLPHPQNQAAGTTLPLQAVPPPPAARLLSADDSFLEDAGTLLGFLHTEQLRLTAQGPHPEDIDRFVQRLQMPFSGDDANLNTRLALLLHLANRLGWLRRSEGDLVQLTSNRVRLFLEKSRTEQRTALWDAWLNSPEWNDLCRTPTLECTKTGDWQNNPQQTRTTLVSLFAKLQPGIWYSQFDFLEAVKTVEPDFQRPTGNYDTWYIRDTDTQEFLKGFEQWDRVEGELLRFLIGGSLHWLSLLDVAEPSAGDDLLFSLSKWGAVWLGHDVPLPYEQARHTIDVGEDFTLTLSAGISLADRFRVERFAQWQASYPAFVYQISQRSLKRAIDEGIGAPQILSFLKAHSTRVPDRVVAALKRFTAT
ncbi:MAG: hypothetical protein KDE19_04870 [Caldilineaceae bacterium]|nr:hypothetical protein [Caldilineaceae bacterium]